MQTYFAADFGKLDYDAAGNILVFVWHRPALANEFREACEMILEAEQYFKTGKLVVDASLQGIIHPANQQWMLEDWAPRAVKAGHRLDAIVLPEDSLVRQFVDEMMSDTNTSVLTTRYFDNLENAIEWARDFQ